MPRRRSQAKAEVLYREFGNLVRILRDARTMRQSDLVEAVQMNRSSITNIEAGKHHITLDRLYDLAAALNVQPAKLLPRQNPFIRSDPLGKRKLP
jgi:transcriptional regulator with XRE-family HTH domain